LLYFIEIYFFLSFIGLSISDKLFADESLSIVPLLDALSILAKFASFYVSDYTLYFYEELCLFLKFKGLLEVDCSPNEVAFEYTRESCLD